MPEELVLAVGPVSQTLSLATLQSYMPPASHWRGVGPNSGLDPDKPSAYVQVFIGKNASIQLGSQDYSDDKEVEIKLLLRCSDRVVEPVMSALVEYVGGPVQEAMGKQVIQAACEAWLQFILQRKIQFRLDVTFQSICVILWSMLTKISIVNGEPCSFFEISFLYEIGFEITTHLRRKQGKLFYSWRF